VAAVNEMLLEALDKGSEKVKGFSKLDIKQITEPF
jgi:hypothetical protein